jgi:hypothetical protein
MFYNINMFYLIELFDDVDTIIVCDEVTLCDFLLDPQNYDCSGDVYNNYDLIHNCNLIGDNDWSVYKCDDMYIDRNNHLNVIELKHILIECVKKYKSENVFGINSTPKIYNKDYYMIRTDNYKIFCYDIRGVYKFFSEKTDLFTLNKKDRKNYYSLNFILQTIRINEPIDCNTNNINCETLVNGYMSMLSILIARKFPDTKGKNAPIKNLPTDLLKALQTFLH